MTFYFFHRVLLPSDGYTSVNIE